MYNITFRVEGSNDDVTISASAGENLLELARKANVAIDAPCGGNGSCGKCRVQIIEGEVESTDSRHIDADDYASGWRLACVSKISCDAKLFVPDIASAYKSRLRVTDLSSPQEMKIFNDLQAALTEAGVAFGSGFESHVLQLDVPTLDDTMPDNERLERAVQSATGAENVEISYALLKKLPDTLRDGDFRVRAVVSRDGDTVKIADITSADDASPVAGIAIDIGTTTVSAVLVNLETGEILAKASTGNGQIRYGADVINRIVEQQKSGGVEKLRRAVVEESLLPVIERLCAEAKLPRERVVRATVAANTTMNHLLLGINANHLRTEPYIPTFFEIPPIAAHELGFDLAPGAEVIIAPNIGSYVGGDITAGSLAAMLWNAEEMTLLVDLGTNGEIVFGNADFLMACACSAGPAFEGGDIRCGMRATDGAVEDCTIDPQTLVPTMTIIGGGKPVGICGSGIIDLIAELFHVGAIDGRGKLARESERIIHDEYNIGRYILAFENESATGREIYINETDIDNFIRTKGAIFSAIMSLLAPLGFAPDDVGKMLVAGGIGSGINIRNAKRIGMFPNLPEETFEYIGNSSLSGAYAALVSSEAAEKLSEVARSITYVELSTHAGYMDEFVAACFLPHTDSSLFAAID